jgi:HK97 family phage major capsid protein
MSKKAEENTEEQHDASTSASQSATQHEHHNPAQQQHSASVAQQSSSAAQQPDPAAVLKSFEERMASIESLIARPASGQKAALIPGDTSTKESDNEAAYCKAFSEYMRSGDRAMIRKAQKSYKAAMEIGTPSEGGYLVPETWSNEAIRALNDIAILRNNGARVQSANTTKGFHVPAIIDSAAAVLTAEEGDYTQGEPTVNEVEFVPYKYTKLALASEELVEDSPLDIWSQVLVPDWAQAFAAAENTATATGNGSSAPQGIISGASNVTDTATSGTFAPEDVITLFHELDHNYRARGVWLLNDSTAKVLRTFREAVYDGTTTTSGGQFLWQPGLREGEPDRLLGRPVVTFNAMAGLTAATSQTAATKFLAFCDPAYFWIVDFGMMYMQRLDELYAAKGRVGFRAFRRFDSNIMLQEAIQVMQIAA